MLRLREYLSIAHHIPGRIRLKLSPGLLTNPEALKLARMVNFNTWGNGSSAIFNTRLNMGAGSLIIDYDAGQVSPDLITELFGSPDANRVKQLVQQLAGLLGLRV